jgi:hypothetical protein
MVSALVAPHDETSQVHFNQKTFRLTASFKTKDGPVWVVFLFWWKI